MRNEGPVQLASFAAGLTVVHLGVQVAGDEDRQRDVILLPAEGLVHERQENVAVTEPGQASCRDEVRLVGQPRNGIDL